MCKRKRRLLIGVMTALHSCVLLLGCAGALAQEGPPGANATGTSVTTGKSTERPQTPVILQLSHERTAGVLTGLAKADIVHEMMVNANGATHYTAVFNDEWPDRVGPVRGLSMLGVSLASMWNAPVVFVSTQPPVDEAVYRALAHEAQATGWRDGAREKGYFSVDTGMPIVDRQFFMFSAWAAHTPLTSQAKEVFTFARLPPKGAREVHRIHLDYSTTGQEGLSLPVTFSYDAQEGCYARAVEGLSQADAGMAFANVIVQGQFHVLEKSVHRNPEIGEYERLRIEAQGSGPFTAYVAGTAVEGYWDWCGDDKTVRYSTYDGEPLALLPGKTMVQVVPMEMYYDRTTETDQDSFCNKGRFAQTKNDPGGAWNYAAMMAY